MDVEADPFQLRADIREALAGALNAEVRHDAEMNRRDELHISETQRRDVLHHGEIARQTELHETELENIRAALETREIIGVAKGVIMATMACSKDEAFTLLRKQSQHENRKLVEVALEIATRAGRGSRPTT